MIRHNSTSIISSLLLNYGDSEDDDNDKGDASGSDVVEESRFVPSESDSPKSGNAKSASNGNSSGFDIKDTAVNISSEDTDGLETETEYGDGEFISDGEENGHLDHQNLAQHDANTNIKQDTMDDVKTKSPRSQGPISSRKKSSRLVPYGPDEDDEDSSSDFNDNDYFEDDTAVNSEINVHSSAQSQCIQNMTNNDVKIPPEPAGKCSYQLQKSIEDMYTRMIQERSDLNWTIQNKKHFRNPSIYHKFIDYCGIDENGSNYPPEIYDPYIWGKESFYDELDKVQCNDMERREKEKKKKVEFITGTKKAVSLADSIIGSSDENKIKTKWDTLPTGMVQVSKQQSVNYNLGVVNLTSRATKIKRKLQ